MVKAYSGLAISNASSVSHYVYLRGSLEFQLGGIENKLSLPSASSLSKVVDITGEVVFKSRNNASTHLATSSASSLLNVVSLSGVARQKIKSRKNKAGIAGAYSVANIINIGAS